MKLALRVYNHLFFAANLPNNINDAAVATYLRSFVIVGGFDSTTRFDTIIRYAAEDGTWQILPTTMTESRLGHVAMAIPSSNC